MRYSPFVQRISGESVSAWDIHYAAIEARAVSYTHLTLPTKA